VEGLHFFHTNIVRDTELKFMHGYGWVNVDVISERFRFEGEGHTLQYHFLVEMGCAEGSLTELIDESL